MSIRERIQKFLDIQPVQQETKEALPFTPRATFNLEEKPEIDTTAYLQSYEGFVYAAISKISKDVAQLDISLHKRLSADNIQDITDHPALDALFDVNTVDTFYTLLERTQLYLDLAGEAFWWLVKDDAGNIVQIWPYLRPDHMEVVTSKEDFVAGYVYNVPGSGDKVPFEREEIIHFKYANPTDPYRGFSPIKAAEFAVATEKESKRWNWRFFKNSAKPFGIISATGTIQDDMYERIVRQWDSSHGGTAQHKVAVLGGGLEYKESGFSQKDMDFLQLRKYSRDEILAILGMPIAVLNPNETVNRATVEAASDIYLGQTIKTRMLRIVETLNEFYLPQFGDDLFFDFKDPSPKDQAADLEYYDNALTFGWLTIDEVRELEGFAPIGEETPEKHVITMRKKTRQEKIKNIVQQELGERTSKPKKPTLLEIQNKQEEAIWRKAVGRMDRMEKILGQLLKREVRRQEQLVQRLVEKTGVIFPMNSEVEKFNKVFEPIVREFFLDNLRREFKKKSIDKVFEGGDIEAWISAIGLKFVLEINETTEKKVNKEIAKGVKEGEGIRELKNRVAVVYKTWSDARLKQFARTESTRQLNAANLEAMKQSPNVIAKKWFTAIDERVCPYCEPMHGKVVPLNENFFDRFDSFQGKADTPLDLSYSDTPAPPLHVNCRCVLIDVFGTELKTDIIEIEKSAEGEKEMEIKKQELEKTIIELQGLKKKAKEALNE